MFSNYALLFSLHRVCVMDMHTSLYYCASLNVCSDDHLLYYVIIVVIYIWFFWCMIKLLIYFTSCLLDHNLLVTLYLSFYYLFYLEGLMCFVQVFQVTDIYVPNSSQLLWFMIGGVICVRKMHVRNGKLTDLLHSKLITCAMKFQNTRTRECTLVCWISKQRL